MTTRTDTMTPDGQIEGHRGLLSEGVLGSWITDDSQTLKASAGIRILASKSDFRRAKGSIADLLRAGAVVARGTPSLTYHDGGGYAEMSISGYSSQYATRQLMAIMALRGAANLLRK